MLATLASYALLSDSKKSQTRKLLFMGSDQHFTPRPFRHMVVWGHCLLPMDQLTFAEQ